MAEQYKIELGIGLKDSDFGEIKKKIQSLEGDSIKLKVDAETKELTNTIREALNSLSKGTKNALTLDTSSIEKSLDRLSDTITDIKTSLGAFDSKSGMKDLLSSINQIAKALGKAENESDSLIKSLSALSKKDLSFNLGIDMGKKNNNMIAYGRAARKQVIPELESQIKYLENLFGGQQATMSKLASQGNKIGFDIFTDFGDFNADSAIKKMEAMEKYINSLKKLAALDDVKLDGFNEQFSKGATELINDIAGVDNAIDKAGDVPEKIKNLFGGSVDGENITRQLDSVVANLGEIKTAIQGLSSGISIDGLTQSFDRLSDTIEKLVQNCTTAKKAINDSLGSLGGSTGQNENSIKNINNDLKQVTVTADNTADAVESIQNAMSGMKFNNSSIEAVTKYLKEMDIVIKEITAKKGKNFDITVKGINSVGEAVDVVRRFNTETGNFEIISTKISKPFKEGEDAARKFRTEVEQAKNIKLDIELGTYDNQMSGMLDKFNRLSGASKELYDSVEDVKIAYKAMEDALDGTGDEVADRERLIQAEERYAKALEKTNNLIRIQAREDKFDADNLRLDDDRQVFQSKIDAWLTKNSAATKKFGATMLDLKAKAENCDRVTLNHLEKQFKKVDNAAEKAGLKMQSSFDKIKSKFKEYMAYFSVAEVFMYVEQGLREMFNTVKEIDTAMTGLYRVTDLTATEYDALFNNMISSAKEYGATLNDIINATTDWVRAGFDANTSLGLAEVTTMYQHISDLDYDTAAENLITAYNGFKDELNGAFDGDTVGAVNYIADILNELDNNYAATSAGIGEALTRSASALDLAGNSIQETAG